MPGIFMNEAGSYRTYLDMIYREYREVNPERVPKEGHLRPDGKLTDTAARELHEELCRNKGMLADEIIRDWNARSPQDDQW